MPTNLEKLKAEIAEMSAEEFAERFCSFITYKGYDKYCTDNICPPWSCSECRVKWLAEESEVDNDSRS